MGRMSGLAAALTAVAIILACVDIPTGADDVLSFQFEPLPFPAVVQGDTLRNASGAVAPLRVSAYNHLGDEVTGLVVRFSALDRRIRVDSVTGIVVGDSASATPSRVLATVDGLTGVINLPVTLRPDTVIGSNVRDSLSYSLTDTLLNVSPALSVKVIHGPAAGDTAVRNYPVTFTVVSPTDTALARLVDESGRRSGTDTTDASGIASRRIRIDPVRLTSQVDSIIVNAAVRYRGTHVRGSPMRLVLRVKPR